ncbi:MAG TPA: SRPBCC domain-containing protein [Sphingomonas sp.]|nr:SRPBCC domain-containing protein [Sphingomonas sp.]
MTDDEAETRTVLIEREIACPPERIWRALTRPHLIAEWLMANDFAPVEGRDFTFTADWGAVECRVLEIEPNRMLSYSWAAMGLESVVTWTLAPSAAGTRLRLEHSGFPAELRQAYQGAKLGWRKFLDSLEQLLARAE